MPYKTEYKFLCENWLTNGSSDRWWPTGAVGNGAAAAIPGDHKLTRMFRLTTKMGAGDDRSIAQLEDLDSSS
jgi:hypothetical protein